MSKTNTWENDLLNLLFNNITAAGIGDVSGLIKSSIDGYLYVSLHTANPDVFGNQTTNETSYSGYTRFGVSRNINGWIISGSNPAQVSNNIIAIYPTCLGGTSTITHVGIGSALSGAGKLLYYGVLASPLIISTNITPTFNVGALVITES